MNPRINKIIMFAILFSTASPVAASDGPQQRPNGNNYEVIAAPGINWDMAKSAAEVAGGKLATITTAAEDVFIDNLRKAHFANEAWVGGFQPIGSAEPGGGWQWLDGDGPFPGNNLGPIYANWLSGEPNDLGGENHLGIGLGNQFGWNDEKNLGNIGGYIIEYDVNPAAVDDMAEAKSQELINIDVLVNDNPMGQTIVSVEIVSGPSDGTATVVGTAPNFTIDYQSNAGFGGDDTFSYEITDSDNDLSNVATVTVAVDGSVAVTQAGANDPIVFGGPGNGVPLQATGDLANTAGESSVRCCSFRDWRVGMGNTKKDGPTAMLWVDLDVGDAMSGDPTCQTADAPAAPPTGTVILSRHHQVHTEDPMEDDPANFRFGVCRVDTAVFWSGPVHLDVTAEGITGLGDSGTGYAVDCKLGQGVDKQPLTVSLTTDPPEFTSPTMRPTTVECDPRGVAKWSTWYFIPNAQHVTEKESSKTYVGRLSSVLKDLIEAMRLEAAADDQLLDTVKGLVLDAERLFKAKKKTAADAQAALVPLDDATRCALDPEKLDGGNPFGPCVLAPALPYSVSPSFDNPQGELVSHLMALRYAVCAERAHVNNLSACRIESDIRNLLPGLLADPAAPSP